MQNIRGFHGKVFRLHTALHTFAQPLIALMKRCSSCWRRSKLVTKHPQPGHVAPPQTQVLSQRGKYQLGFRNHLLFQCYYLIFIYFFAHFHFPASGQAVVTGVIPSPPRFLPSIFIAHRVQQSHCSSIVHRVLLTHALALSASQFVHKKKSQRIYTSMHSAGLELTKLTYTRLEDNLIRHR